MVATPEALLTSVLILLSPLFLALPLSLGWRWWVGTEPEHEHYREKIRRVLDAGIPLRRYRAELDAEARRFLIDPERQARIESDLLHPLRMQHFILLPSLIVWPVLGFFAAIIAIPLMPVLRAIEWVLIDKRALSLVAKIIQGITRWEIIGIPRLDDGAKELDRVLISVHRLPITVFLGLFAYLVVLYLPLDARGILLLSGAVYIVLVSITSVVRAATANALVFADPTTRRLTPMDTFVEDALGPLVGVGLVFLVRGPGGILSQRSSRALHSHHHRCHSGVGFLPLPCRIGAQGVPEPDGRVLRPDFVPIHSKPGLAAHLPADASVRMVGEGGGV